MSLEFLTWPHMEKFFGDDAERFRQTHLTDSLLFLPYGVAVDHFQHLVYENPDAGPDHLLIGYVGRNSGHKRPDLALRAFAHVATGAFAVCDSCGWLSVADLDRSLGFLPVKGCRHCGSDCAGWPFRTRRSRRLFGLCGENASPVRSSSRPSSGLGRRISFRSPKRSARSEMLCVVLSRLIGSS